MPIPNPYHEGELRIQELAGELQDAEHTGRAIADAIIRGALKFIAQQPMAVLGSVDHLRDVAPALDRAGGGAWGDMWRVAPPMAATAFALKTLRIRPPKPDTR